MGWSFTDRCRHEDTRVQYCQHSENSACQTFTANGFCLCNGELDGIVPVQIGVGVHARSQFGENVGRVVRPCRLPTDAQCCGDRFPRLSRAPRRRYLRALERVELVCCADDRAQSLKRISWQGVGRKQAHDLSVLYDRHDGNRYGRAGFGCCGLAYSASVCDKTRSFVSLGIEAAGLGVPATRACDNEQVRTRLVLRLAGERVQLGQADAVDVARLIVGINTVVRRTASVLAGRRPGQRGRLPRQIADAVRLHLRSVSDGSLVVELELHDDAGRSDEMVLDDVSLGEASVLTALAVLDGSATGFADTATAWTRLAGRLDIGGRNHSLTLSVPSHARSPVLLDRDRRARIDLVLGRPVTDFWTTKSVSELANEQGVAPVAEIEDLRIEDVGDGETKAFVEALGL